MRFSSKVSVSWSFNMAGKNIRHLGLHVQCWFMPDCNQSGISRKIFITVANIKFHVKSTSGSLVDTCGWTNGRTDRYLEANRRICRLCEGICKSYVAFPSVSVVPCTIGRYVQTHSEFSVSSNTFWQISPLFGRVSAGCIRVRIIALFVH